MKKSIIYLPLIAAGFLATGCNDLDQLPNSNYVTTEQKQDAVAQNPELASAGVNALPQQLISYQKIFENHIDFGLPSCILALESRGQDMPAPNINYNWFSPCLTLEDFNGRYFMNLIHWYYNYYTIRSANALLKQVPESEEPKLCYFRAQGFVFRAYCYFNLAQMYQFTYAKNPDAPCVPILTDKNEDGAATEGCPRGTVKEVYDQILSDLTEAIRLFELCESKGVNRATAAESANIVKTFANSTVAYGLRARANLFKCDYAAALTDAEKALTLADAEGLSPYSMAEASVPAFTTLQDHNFVWGCFNDPTQAEFKGIANWASHMTGFQTNGYAGAGAYRSINKSLYESIPTTDVRKKWWLDGEGNPPSSLPEAYAKFIATGYAEVGNEPFPAYAQLKFGSYQNTPQTIGAVDLAWMRYEELLLIQAEAQGMSDIARGSQLLEAFVKTYRNPSYSFKATSTEDFQNEIWMQRRVELWGEGFSYWDLMRYQKGIDRRGGGYSPECCYLVSPSDPVMLLDIPEAEVQRNPLITSGTNGAVKPTPVEDI